MDLRDSFEKDIAARTAASRDKQSLLNECVNNFMQQATTFASRHEFDQFLREMEQSYFGMQQPSQHLYRNPNDGRQMQVPAFPAKPTLQQQREQSTDELAETASKMHDLRRGIDRGQLSQSELSHFSGVHSQLSNQKPFLEQTGSSHRSNNNFATE